LSLDPISFPNSLIFTPRPRPLHPNTDAALPAYHMYQAQYIICLVIDRPTLLEYTGTRSRYQRLLCRPSSSTGEYYTYYVMLHYITLQNKFVIRQIQKCPTAKYIIHLKCTVMLVYIM